MDSYYFRSFNKTVLESDIYSNLLGKNLVKITWITMPPPTGTSLYLRNIAIN